MASFSKIKAIVDAILSLLKAVGVLKQKQPFPLEDLEPKKDPKEFS